MKMRCIPDLQKRWLRGRLLVVAKKYGQNTLRCINGEKSTLGQAKSPSSYQEQYDHREWDSCFDIGGASQTCNEDNILHCGANMVSALLDHQPPPSLQNQYGQFDDVKIDPALLTDDFKVHQQPEFDGANYEQELSALSPLQPELIPVV
jgi:hypothetical protein